MELWPDAYLEYRRTTALVLPLSWRVRRGGGSVGAGRRVGKTAATGSAR